MHHRVKRKGRKKSLEGKEERKKVLNYKLKENFAL